jgi:hypothetical protein
VHFVGLSHICEYFNGGNYFVNIKCRCVTFVYECSVLPPWQPGICRYVASGIVRADVKYIIIVITRTITGMAAQCWM